MSNPLIDPRASADQVLVLLRSGQGVQALARLGALRQGQPLVLQEALDRYVAGEEPQRLAALKAQASPAELAALIRLDEARQTPRLPDIEPDANGQNELSGLSASQQHDVYASIVYTRGNEAARLALERGDRVLLGLRQETSTLAAMESSQRPHVPRSDDPATRKDESSGGTGVYDDQMVVLWRTPETGGDLHLVRRASTEPTAQYDHHAGSDGLRNLSDERDKDGNRVKVPEREANPGFEDVWPLRKVEGVDADGDGVRDAGRLSEGTYEMFGATHGKGESEHRAFRPTPAAVGAGANKIERDTNGDGVFDASDRHRLSDLDRSFKIHRGSTGNTDSAGCQTVRGVAEYTEFLAAAIPSGSSQTRWQYVLTEVAPSFGSVRSLETTVPEVAPGSPQGAAPVSLPPDTSASSAASTSQITPEQRAGVYKAYGDIGTALQGHGHSLDESVRVCAACAALEARQGDVTRFLLSKDGARIGAVHRDHSLSEFDVSAALARSVAEHLSGRTEPRAKTVAFAMDEPAVPALGALQR